MTLYYSPTAGFRDTDLHANIPSDSIKITPAQREALVTGEANGKRIAVSNGRVILDDPAPATTADLLTRLTAAIQSHLDTTAQAAGYDNIYTAVSYADEPAVPKFQAEGTAFRAWRSLVWAAANAIRSEVESGARPVPTIAQLISELPLLSLPE